jgi:hypothetical protein
MNNTFICMNDTYFGMIDTYCKKREC